MLLLLLLVVVLGPCVIKWTAADEFPPNVGPLKVLVLEPSGAAMF